MRIENAAGRPPRREFGDEAGGVLVMFAIGLVVILGVIGLAIDYGRATSARTQLQTAVDAALLSASNPSLADEDREGVFQRALHANLATADLVPVVTFSYTASQGGTAVGTAPVPTTFSRVLGFDRLTVSVESHASPRGHDIEIVFVLDISGSMNYGLGGSSRMEALKLAADRLIDILEAKVPSGQSVKFAVVPFNMAVNIGTANTDYVEGLGNPLLAGSEWAGCVLERPNGGHHLDVFNDGASDGTGRWPVYIWPPEPDAGSSCLNPSDGTNSGYASKEAAPLGLDPWIKGPSFNCPRFAITPLTGDAGTARDAVDELIAFGNMGTTFGPALGWALRVLSPEEPFTEGAAFSDRTRKIIVVLTDGEQVTDGIACSGTNSSGAYSFDPASLGLQGDVVTSAPHNNSFTPYGYLVDSDPFNSGLSSALDADEELDRLTLEACDEAKTRTSEGIMEIFSIAVSADAGPGTRAYDVLSQCASSPAHFHYATTEGELQAVFEAIGEEALKLRLTH
ncbi:MAG: pilus assembly protein [Hyphomicrobiaceae bacterium]